MTEVAGPERVSGQNINSETRSTETPGGRMDNGAPSSGLDTTEVRKYNSVQEYSQTLQQWLCQYRYMSSAQSFYSMLPMYMSNPMMTPFPNPPHPHGMGQSQPGVTIQRATHTHQGLGQNTQPMQQGTEYLIPSVWRRLGAELIDFFILFYIKLMVSIGVMRQMGILESDNLELEGFYRTIILNPDDVDLEKLFALSSELIALEVVNRICITLVETLCLRQGVGVIGGSTPGKRILGMCVVSCVDSQDLGNGRIRVTPAQNIGLKRALVRSVIKNFTMAFFFPACLTIFFFRHNRAAYDVIAGTIVVQYPQFHDQRR